MKDLIWIDILKEKYLHYCHISITGKCFMIHAKGTAAHLGIKSHFYFHDFSVKFY